MNANSLSIKNISFKLLAVVAAAGLVLSWLVATVSASSVVQVTSNIADVPGGASLVLTVGAQNDGDVHELEIDHSLASILPEFSVYANEANPYGGQDCGTASDQDCVSMFSAAGVQVTYSAGSSQWVIDFGDNVTDEIRDSGGDVKFYFVLRDSNREILWGSMDSVTPENTFTFDVEAGTGSELLPEEAVIPGVPNTSVGR